MKKEEVIKKNPKAQKKRDKETKNKWNIEKTANKMVVFNLNVSMIILSVSILNTSVKKEIVQML